MGLIKNLEQIGVSGKEFRINYINAISTSVLAFAGVIGLILALAEFIGNKSTVLGFGGAVWIVTLFVIGLFFTIYTTKRWIEHGGKK